MKLVVQCAPEDTGDGSDDIHESRRLSCTSGCPGCIFMRTMSANIHHAQSFLQSQYSLHLPASRDENATAAYNRDKETTAISDRLQVGILELVLCFLGSTAFITATAVSLVDNNQRRQRDTSQKHSLKTTQPLLIKRIFACKTTSLPGVLKYV